MSKIRMFGVYALLLALFSPGGVVTANDTPLTYDRIDLAVTAARDVDNDILIAILYYQREGEDAAELANEVNKNIRWALGEVKQNTAVKSQTLDYYTHPVYRNQKLQGWRVSQSIRLESRDSAQLSQMIATLQQHLAVRSIRYSVSPERRQEVENELIVEAVKEFGQRAAVIAKALGRDAYRLVQMHVNASGISPMPRKHRALALEATAASAPPALEAGTQSLQINVSGTIELKLN